MKTARTAELEAIERALIARLERVNNEALALNDDELLEQLKKDYWQALRDFRVDAKDQSEADAEDKEKSEAEDEEKSEAEVNKMLSSSDVEI